MAWKCEKKYSRQVQSSMREKKYSLRAQSDVREKNLFPQGSSTCQNSKTNFRIQLECLHHMNRFFFINRKKTLIEKVD